LQAAENHGDSRAATAKSSGAAEMRERFTGSEGEKGG